MADSEEAWKVMNDDNFGTETANDGNSASATANDGNSASATANETQVEALQSTINARSTNWHRFRFVYQPVNLRMLPLYTSNPKV